AFANPKAIMEAQKNASGDQYDRLSAMGPSEEKIRDKQNEYRMKPENFGIMSDKERGDLLAGINTRAPLSADQSKFVDSMASSVDASRLLKDDGKPTDMAQQIAAGISASALGRLPENIGNILRPMVAEL